jgi:hypothetical protein
VEHFIAALAIGILVSGLFIVSPGLRDGVDYVFFYKPNFQFLVDAVKAGHLPLWNPYIGLGRPFLADLQNAVFYPPIYLLLLGSQFGLFLLVWLHCLLAVFGMRRLARSLGCGKAQSYLVAFAFLFCGAVTPRLLVGQIMYFCAVAYIPVLFLYASRAEEWNARVIAKWAAFLALQFLCGHPQVFWFSSLGQAIFILSRAIQSPVRKSLVCALRAEFQFAAALLWCAALAAVVLLPFLELIKHGNRSTVSHEFVNYVRLDWIDFFGLFTRTPADYELSWEQYLFIGVGLLVPGLMGLSKFTDRNVRGVLGLVVLSTLVAVGDATPFFYLFYDFLPGFTNFRMHARAGLLIDFGLLLAAGRWLTEIDASKRSKITILCVAAVVLCFAIAFFPFHRSSGQILPLAPLALTLMLVVSLCWMAANAKSSGSQAFRRALAGLMIVQAFELGYGIRYQRKTYSFQSVMRVSTDYFQDAKMVNVLASAGLMQQGQPPPRVFLPNSKVHLNYGMIYGFSHCDAYTSLFLKRPWDYMHAITGVAPPPLNNTSLAHGLYDQGPFPFPDLGLVLGMDETGNFVVNSNPAPRAFIVYNASPPLAYSEILAKLKQGHQIHQTALVESPLARALPSSNSIPGNAASIRVFESNSLRLDVDAKEDGLLVLAEAWYPGWKAQINGKICDAIPVNGWMRAFPVPAGKNAIAVFFRQNYLSAGAAITVMAIIGLILVLASRYGNANDKNQKAN